jgi:pimeloyl-ACP methyl ester carboxylesterase
MSVTRRVSIYLFFCSILLFPFVSLAAGPTAITGEITVPTTWTKEWSPYKVSGNVAVKAPLTIEAGTVVKFGISGLDGLKIQNEFFVNGTREEPVVFTSLRDDEYGGDTNGDGSRTKPTIGSWSQIMFNPAKDYELKIKYAKILYANFGVSFYPSAIQTKEISIKKSEIRKNGIGINISNANALIESNIISENVDYGISANVSTKTPKVVNNSISNNTTGARGINSSNPGQIALEAENNWWGAKSGPYNEIINPDGAGNPANGQVFFSPWINEDPISTPDPVIIIPGIMGSWEVNGEWKIDPILHSFENLKKAMNENGYVSGVNMFDFPYQWRNSNIDNAKLLRDAIDVIKEETGRPKVDIVSHSMGGLLAREYIESDYYQGDVDQLITLGTPHNGAPKTYLIWEAGEFSDTVGFLTKKLFSREAKKAGFDNLLHYLRNRPMESARELLPTYDYIFDLDLKTLREYPNSYPQNEFLENLNSDANKNKLRKIEFVNIYGEVDEKNTIKKFEVIDAPAFGDYWEHGYPIDYYSLFWGTEGVIYGEGDETVPLDSALSINANYNIKVNASHNQIPTEAQQDVIEILTGKRPTSKVTSEGPEIKEIMMVQVYCPVDIQVISPSGKIIGKNFENNQEFNEINGAVYINNGDDEEFLTIPNPESGEYKIRTQGTGEGGDYQVLIVKITEDKNNPEMTKESEITFEGTATSEIIEKNFIMAEDDTVSIPEDTTSPNITGAATAKPNADGWYNGDVTVHFDASDAESGLDTVTPDITISTEGENQSATGTATDKAGNSASFTVSGINIDKTAPTIVINSPENEKTYLNNQILPINYSIIDNLSPPDKINSTIEYDNKIFSKKDIDLSLEHLGNHALKITATDAAGNAIEKENTLTSKTNIDAIQQNVDHYLSLNLIKTKYEKAYLTLRLGQIKELFKMLNQLENSILNPTMKKMMTDGIKKIIDSNISQLVYHITHALPQLIDQKIAELMVEDLNFIRP